MHPILLLQEPHKHPNTILSQAAWCRAADLGAATSCMPAGTRPIGIVFFTYLLDHSMVTHVLLRFFITPHGPMARFDLCQLFCWHRSVRSKGAGWGWDKGYRNQLPRSTSTLPPTLLSSFLALPHDSINRIFASHHGPHIAFQLLHWWQCSNLM